MKVVQAMEMTAKIAFERNIPTDGDLGYAHIAGMVIQVHEATGRGQPFSYGKLCRWLGWMQAAVVSHGVATLDDMKAINQLCKG